jgi:ornithine cyclodeaminase/alanine dehydrogenase-like protein (mu-crystallin family)
VETAASALEAVAGADVAISAAPIVEDARPALHAGALGERWLGLPIDFDASFSRELVESADLLLTDDVEQFEAYRGHGYFSGWPSPGQSVGEGLKQGAGGWRVLCCNLGVGALDAAFAHAALEHARAQDIGVVLPR